MQINWRIQDPLRRRWHYYHQRKHRGRILWHWAHSELHMKHFLKVVQRFNSRSIFRSYQALFKVLNWSLNRPREELPSSLSSTLKPTREIRSQLFTRPTLCVSLTVSFSSVLARLLRNTQTLSSKRCTWTPFAWRWSRIQVSLMYWSCQTCTVIFSVICAPVWLVVWVWLQVVTLVLVAPLSLRL